MTAADWIALGNGVVFLIFTYVVALINGKISQLRADIFETFLTKRDYFDFQNRRSYSATHSERRK